MYINMQRIEINLVCQKSLFENLKSVLKKNFFNLCDIYIVLNFSVHTLILYVETIILEKYS